MKTITTIIVTAVLLVISSSVATAGEGTCEECRQLLSAIEQTLRQSEQAYYMTHTGGSPMMDPNIRILSEDMQRVSVECNRVCSAGPSQGGYGQQPNNGYGGGNRQGGYGQPRGAPSGPDPDNPFEDTGGRASANDPDDPFANIGNSPGDDDDGGGNDRQARSGSSGGKGGTAASTSAGSSKDDKSAKSGENDDDKPLKFNTRSCNYFTQPQEKDRIKSYAKGSKVCYGKWMYECTEERGWISIGQCSDYDKFFVKHAEDIEKSRFNTNILLDY